MPIRVMLAVVALALGATVSAEIGQPPSAILERLSSYAPEPAAGGFEVGEGFTFDFELRNGVVYAVTGRGELDPVNVALLGDLVGAATGYGEAIAQPTQAFFDTRAAELAGQGPVALGVEGYLLELEVTGDAAPYLVDFKLTLQEVPEELFPEARHVLGPADARYVVREFSDFQCPYCARFAREALPLLEELLARGDVRFEFHHFPLQSIHANAAPAAEAAECVAEAGGAEAFWRYHDALFERQRAWQSLGDPGPYFLRLAQDLGLGAPGLSDCLEERRYAGVVREAYRAAAQDLGLTATPSVFVDGFKVRDYLDLQSYLELMETSRAFGGGE